MPYIIVLNKADLGGFKAENDNEIAVSAKTGEHIFELKEKLAAIAAKGQNTKVILVTYLSAATTWCSSRPSIPPRRKAAVILPQVQAIRDILDAGATCSVTQVEELAGVLNGLKTPPKLVVTDSQAFGKVKQIVPESIKLTSFSILFARYKGVLRRPCAALRLLRI